MQTRKRTRTIHHKSAYPIYAAAALFLLWGIAAPIYRLWAFLSALATSAAAYFALDRFVFTGRDEVVEEEILTGDAELDGFIRQARLTLRHFRDLASQAGDETIRSNLSRIADATESLVDEVIRDPKDRRDVYTFFSYYLPAMEKLMNYYETFLAAGSGENVQAGKTRIENSLGMVAQAFEKQLDRLFHNEAMDVKTDIALMETMLRMDGLMEKTSTGKGGTNV